MPQTIYVYSPVTAYITGMPGGYCSCNPISNCPHPSVPSGYSDPVDIGGGSVSPNTVVYFSGSPNIQSIQVMPVTQNNICSKWNQIPLPWDGGVEVKFYLEPDASYYVGSVFYAHLAEPMFTGIWNAYQMPIGKIATTSGCQSPCSGCYPGMHIHITRKNGQLASGFGCSNYIYGAITPIYRWTV